MKIKKKLIAGSMTAALGLSLVAGGTWAAFNDVEATSGSFQAGTLKMDINELDGKPYTFEISNLKPGDHMTRDIEFENTGTLAIEQVLMAIEAADFSYYVPDEIGDMGYGDTWSSNVNTSLEDYLDQFEVTVIGLGIEEGGSYDKDIILEKVSLKDFYLASSSINGDGHKNGDISQAMINVLDGVDNQYIDFDSRRLNVVTEDNTGWEGLPVDPEDRDGLRLTIEFKDDTEKDSNGEYLQNVYQGNKVDLHVSFEATQWEGMPNDGNGYIKENERTNTNRDGTNRNP